jgi:hypothetical protein
MVLCVPTCDDWGFSETPNHQVRSNDGTSIAAKLDNTFFHDSIACCSSVVLGFDTVVKAYLIFRLITGIPERSGISIRKLEGQRRASSRSFSCRL